MGVAVMGVGLCGAFPTSSGLSYREMVARAATIAYEDAGVAPSGIDGAVAAEEDLVSGYSICDEYVPDQLGMPRKPVYTISGDFLHALASASMQIATGRFETVVVVAFSKASNIMLKDELLGFAFDPLHGRLGVSPHYLAALEMSHFLDATGRPVTELARVVEHSKRAALGNPAAPYGVPTTMEDILAGDPVATPLTRPMIARHADGAVVAVLGSLEAARRSARSPVFLTGMGWGSGTSVVERRHPTVSLGTELAADAALTEAGIEDPSEEIDIFYLSDLYPHRLLMHLDALGLGDEALGATNPDGGSMGMGDLLEANGGARLYDAVLQLRGEAGSHQVEGARRALVQAWRGLPTDSCAVAVLDARRSS